VEGNSRRWQASVALDRGKLLVEKGNGIRMMSKPSGKCGLRNITDNLSNTMFKETRDAKDHGVPRANIRHLDHLARVATSDLKDTARVNISAQVNADANKTILTNIVVPRIAMPATRKHTIYPPFEASSSIASGYVLNDLKQLFIVH
jgi:hypothetical protein